jgi:hypothetical protein
MKKKGEVIGDSPLLFMEWPNIEIDDRKITLRSSVTKVTITKSSEDAGQKENHFFHPLCPLIESRIKNSI